MPPEDIAPIEIYNKLSRKTKWRWKFAGSPTISSNGSKTWRLSNDLVLRQDVLATEYEAMTVVALSTKIPVPKVLGVYRLPQGRFVELEQRSAKQLSDIWLKLNNSQKRRSVQDLGRYVNELRAIEPHSRPVIGSASLGAVYEPRFGRAKAGPFYGLEDFHEFLRRGHPPTDFEEEELQRCHTRNGTETYKLKFTHGALCPQNILVDNSGRIVHVTGWMSAGWYPEYWEYTNMHHVVEKRFSDWLAMMEGVMPRYDEEVVAEEALRNMFTMEDYEAPLRVRKKSITASEFAKEQEEIDLLNTESTSG